MIMLRARAVEEKLLDDPWISDARIHLDWPNEVIVGVVERVPVAWVQTADGWTRRSLDGASLPGGSVPDESLPKAILPAVGGPEASTSPLVLASVEFYTALPTMLWPSSVIRLESGELWATVDGYDVRLAHRGAGTGSLWWINSITLTTRLARASLRAEVNLTAVLSRLNWKLPEKPRG